jgi:hypothetical protein
MSLAMQWWEVVGSEDGGDVDVAGDAVVGGGGHRFVLDVAVLFVGVRVCMGVSSPHLGRRRHHRPSEHHQRPIHNSRGMPSRGARSRRER